MFECLRHRHIRHGLLIIALMGGLCVGCKTAPKQATADGAAGDAPGALAADAERYSRGVNQSLDSKAPSNGQAEANEIQWLNADPTGTVAQVPPATPLMQQQQQRADASHDAAPLNVPTPPTQPARPPSTSPPPITPSAAAPSASPADPVELARRLRAQLARRARDDDNGLKPYLSAAAMSLVDPANELDSNDLASLSREDRQIVLAYQRLFTMLGRQLGRDGQDAEQLRLACEELAEQVDTARRMRIRRCELCSRVKGFGQYTPFAEKRFMVGREHPVIVYSELEHFTPRVVDQQQYVVHLQQEVVLYNASDGLAVWRVKPTEIIDRSRNRRRDFFVVQIINLPARLTVGKYLLSITVTDEVGQQVDEAKLPLEIVAQ